MLSTQAMCMPSHNQSQEPVLLVNHPAATGGSVRGAPLFRVRTRQGHRRVEGW